MHQKVMQTSFAQALSRFTIPNHSPLKLAAHDVLKLGRPEVVRSASAQASIVGYDSKVGLGEMHTRLKILLDTRRHSNTATGKDNAKVRESGRNETSKNLHHSRYLFGNVCPHKQVKRYADMLVPVACPVGPLVAK
jgi:hypothetical protein